MNRYELDSISRQFNAAVKEIEINLKNEVEEYQHNKEILCFDILKNVKEQAERDVPNLKDLPVAQKKKYVIDLMQSIINGSANILEEMKPQAAELVEQIATPVFDLWKEAN